MATWVGLLGILLIAFACYPRRFEATATPQEGLTITYSVSPLFTVHGSDWKRAVRVKYGQGMVRQGLFEDTGWWRGSHLYRHTSGNYVIHEGQNGCFGIDIDPLKFTVPAKDLCQKVTGDLANGGGTSRFYPGLTYLGKFDENTGARDGAPIRFIPVDELAEQELPALL